MSTDPKRKPSTNFRDTVIESKIYIELIVKIIVTFATILLTFQANQILKQQNIINEREIERSAMEVAPAFLFSKSEDNEYTFYEMTNSKGFISNVYFEKIDRVNFYGYSQERNYFKAVIDFSKISFPQDDISEGWIIRDDNSIDINDFADQVVNKINLSLDSGSFYYITNSYYHVIYNDFQNIRHEEYYSIDFEGAGLYTVEYSTIENIFEKGGSYLFSTESKFYSMNEKDYNKIVDTAVNEIQKHFNN